MDARLAVRRKPEFRNEEATLLSSIGQDGEVAIYYLYDAFDATEEDLVALRESVVADSRVDELVELPAPAELGNYLAVEPLSWPVRPACRCRRAGPASTPSGNEGADHLGNAVCFRRSGE